MRIPLLFPEDPGGVCAQYQAEDALSDLFLDPVFMDMADGDQTIDRAVRKIICAPLVDERVILHRQAVMTDVLEQPKAVEACYRIAGRVLRNLEAEPLRLSASQSITTSFQRCRARMQKLLGALHELHAFAEQTTGSFHSAGFTMLLDEWSTLLDERFFSKAEALWEELGFAQGMRVSARMGIDGRLYAYCLLHCDKGDEGHASGASYALHDDARWQSDWIHRRETALSGVNQALFQAVTSITEYLQRLREELAFFMGGLHLYQKLVARGIPVCMPRLSRDEWAMEALIEQNVARDLKNPVGNSLRIRAKCCIITGADLGGKTTFLRAVGQAQLFMQAGLFVTATSYAAPAANGVFTHFQKEEDPSLISGKLAEELDRFHAIVERIRSGALLLSDESFCSTNEKEGSEISLQIVKALLQKGITVFSVTHLYPFAMRMLQHDGRHCAFLCAQRLPDGTRTHRMVPGAPQSTAYCKDLYDRIVKEQEEGRTH